MIAEVQDVKSGTGRNNQPWTLSNVIDDEGTKYTTFDGVAWRNEIGNAVVIAYEEEKVPGKKEGQWFTNRKIISQPKAKWNPSDIKVEPIHDDEPRPSYKETIKLNETKLPNDQAQLHAKLDMILKKLDIIIDKDNPLLN